MAKSEAWPRENCSRLNAEWDIMEGGIGGRPASQATITALHRNTTDNTPDGIHVVFSTLYLSDCTGCPARPGSLEMQIDWVRVWQ